MKISRYIYWDKDATKIEIVGRQKWNKFVDTLDWNKYIPYEIAQGNRFLTIRMCWIDNAWTYQWKVSALRLEQAVA